MSFAEWDDSYSVGIKRIDDQHRTLFKLINELNNLAMRKAAMVTFQDVMEGILEYTTYHFYSEEEFMRKIGYPMADAHKAEHDAMRERMRKYYAKCISEDFSCLNQVLEELIDWLHTHLGRSDNQYAEFFRQKGGEQTGD